jgi:membrane protease YdiL (CAAX protease family)
MNNSLMIAVAGVLVALAVTTTMDATGYAMFSALPLALITGSLWALQRFSRAEIGLVWGDRRSYALALAYPAVVLGLITLIAYGFGAVDSSDADWEKVFLNMAAGSSIGVLGVLITEEGFFRGWLWAALKRAGQSDTQVLIWTSVSFTVWHISAVSLDTGFDIPAAEIPVYLVNATLIGGVFGLLRMISGSVVVASVCHAVWNAIDYPLYGFGEKVGALGIEATHLFGPEVGVLGIAINSIFAASLWYWWRTQTNASQTTATRD